jgi:hypothetical protein
MVENPAFIRKKAENLWKQAGILDGEEEMRLRYAAVELLKESIEHYAEKIMFTDQLITESKKERWLGVIKDHEADFEVALTHYKNALTIEKSTDDYHGKNKSMNILKGHIEECQAEIVIMDNIRYGKIPYTKIISHFGKAEEYYYNAGSMKFSNFCKGYKLLFQWLKDDKYPDFKEYINLNNNLNIDILNYNPSSKRSVIKKFHFIDKIKPYYERSIFRFFWSRCTVLENELNIIRKQMHNDDINFEYRIPYRKRKWYPKSLQNGINIMEDRLKIKTTDLINLLKNINHEYKHENISELETKRIENEVIKIKPIMIVYNVDDEINVYINKIKLRIKEEYNYVLN